MNSPQHTLISLSCGDLGRRIQLAVKPWVMPICAASLVGTFLLVLFEFPHAVALLWILGGCLLPLVFWSRLRTPGVPLVILIAIQTFAIFGTAILTRNISLQAYSAEAVNGAGFEIFVFCVALTSVWRLTYGAGSRRLRPVSYWGLDFIRIEKPVTLARAALLLLLLGTGYEVLHASGLLIGILQALPSGAFSIIRTVFDAATLAGCLVGGYAVGSRLMPRRQASTFWGLFAVCFVVKVSGILLSSATGIIATTMLGYFLGARRPPYMFLVTIISILAFLNLSKFEMRAKYWNDIGYSSAVKPADYPGYFAEWSRYSINILTFNRTISGDDETAGQRLTDRLDNLQNLLYAQHGIQERDIELLAGETYTIIPKLLIPRVFWSDKPRTHEGQILLNIHFGRQSLLDSFTTYIAWGLLAEAYANFGSVWGALLCGSFLGAIAGRIESWANPYPVPSLQTFFFLIVAVNFSLSFEMVASVWITSAFQMVVALLLCVIPFARRRLMPEPPQPGENPA